LKIELLPNKLGETIDAAKIARQTEGAKIINMVNFAKNEVAQAA
jgi:hypothetical protein